MLSGKKRRDKESSGGEGVEIKWRISRVKKGKEQERED